MAGALSVLITASLVDKVLEPAVGGPGWELVAPIVGSQPGAGMGLLLVVAGLIVTVTTVVVYAWPKIRNMERDIPDYAPPEGQQVAVAYA